MLEQEKETQKEWNVWVNPSKKTVYLKEAPNAKKISFETDEARVEFAAKLVFKGYSIG